MIVILGAAFRCFHRHMAVRAAEHRGMLAVGIGFQLRMLRLEHLRAGSRLLPIAEAQLIIIGQDRFGRHFSLAVVRHHRLAVFRREIVLDMALPAGK